MGSEMAMLQLGVNIFGYLYAENGMGEQCRQLVHAVRQTGIPYAAIPYTRTLTRQNHLFDEPFADTPRFPINIVVVNADELPHFAADVGERFLRSRYTIGVWAWEIEDFPRSMARSQRYLDEIWAISRFGAEAIERKVDRPVFSFPVPVSVPERAASAHLAIELPESFVFLFCFDFDSVFERKNPMALVKTFREAFPGDEQVSLLIKSTNGSRAPDKLQLLRGATDGDSRITLIDEYWDAEQMEALMASCDAYVSLHRSEGFGLTMAEAMALERPVIATAYSGNLDFMNDGNSYLVPAHSAEVPDGCAPYPKGAIWSEPDIGEAAALMRRVVSSPDEARKKAARGRAEIEQHHSPAARSHYVERRLVEISKSPSFPDPSSKLPELGSGLHSDLPAPAGDERPRAAGFVGVPNVGESEGLAQLSARLEEGPDLRRATGLGRPGLWLRRLIFRLLRNYHLHGLEIGRSSLLVLRELDRRLRETRQQLEILGQRIDRIEHQIEARSDPGDPRKHE